MELFTADPAPLNTPTEIVLPDNCVTKESLKWSCKFASGLPIGITDTPTLTVTFNLETLLATPELDFLRNRLLKPFLIENVAPTVVPAYTETQRVWVVDANEVEGGYWQDVITNIPAQTIEPDVKEYKLTNVIILKSDKGDSALDEANFRFMFTGCQRLSPTAKLFFKTARKGAYRPLSVEFMHSARFVLEQISPSSVVTKLRSKVVQNASYAANVEFQDNPKKAQFIEQQKNVDASNAGMVYYKVSDFYAVLEEITNEVTQKVDRTSVGTSAVPTGGWAFGLYYAADPTDFSKGLGVTSANMWFLGSVLEPPNGERRGGMLDNGSPLHQRETMFDALKEMYEAGSIVRYSNARTFFHIDKMYGTENGSNSDPTIVLSADMLELDDDGEQGFKYLRGVELNANGISNIRYTQQGASFADTDWALKLFWHNATPPPEGDKKEESDADRVISQKYSITKLYAQNGQNMIAVHPSCAFDTGKAVKNTALITKTAPYDLTGVLRRDWKWGKPEAEYVFRAWTETTGYHSLVANELLVMFGNYEQIKIPAKTAHLTALAGCTPLAVGQWFTFEAGVFPAGYPQVTKAWLTASEFALYDGVQELEFFAPKEGVL
jgi:hypothetical protein